MTTKRILSGVSAAMIAFASCLETGAGTPEEFFETKIRPVLAEHCYECHSASAKKMKGGLRVDGRQELLSGGDTGPAIVPGKPEASLLITAIAHRDSELEMPPKQQRLANSVIADFEKWIRDGAVWPGASNRAPVLAKDSFDMEGRKRAQAWLWKTPDKQKLPFVKDSKWPSEPEDFFILRKLEENGLQPAAPADDRTWLRRVHFVLTGLPPTREQIREFLADKREGARERVVDQLLASPNFGERWARHWMDLVRYAESRGHEGDYIIANAWQYRDYLIRAFNADVPYNQFVMEHVAGDLLPKPRLRPGTDINESVLATGWPFLGEENHSPVDIRGDECERIDNKVDVFSKTFLGLTVSCARCHDHKFDPIRAQDYYALSGFMLGSSYRQVRFETMENNRARGEELEALRAEFTPKLAKGVADASSEALETIATNLLRARDRILDDGKSSVDDPQLQKWAEHLRLAATNSASPLHLFASWALGKSETPARESSDFELPADARVIADFTKPGVQPWKVDGQAFGKGPLTVGTLVLGNDPAHPIGRVMTYGAARRDLFWKGLKTKKGNENDSGRLAATSRAGQMLRTPTITLESGKLHYLIRGKTRVYAAVDSHLMIEGPLHGQLARTFDGGLDAQPRWVTHDLSAYLGHRTHVEFGPEGDAELEVLMVVEGPEVPKSRPETPYVTAADADSIEEYAKRIEDLVIEACAQLGRGCIDEEHAAAANWLVQNPDLLRDTPDAAVLSVGKTFLERQAEIASRVEWESHTAVAWFDGTGVDEHVLVRGKPFKPGALAPRSMPAAFDSAEPITCSASSGRYELARQMVDPANPLVARVIVNRVWHHVFGRGIVASVDNFGALGDQPSHPELLDHLAWHFVHQDNWSLKRLLKRLVLTRTFGMSSVAADEKCEERDPANVLLHRMPVRRLEGEVIRDALLAVSGRLSASVGGPPEPVHLTEFLVGRGRPEKSGPLDGDGRRSVYISMRRNFLPTFMQTFDAPTPFSTVGRRNVTNVPAQSLALMNDPLFHQQAEVWAKRLLAEMASADAAERIRWLFESAYGRLPSEAEIASCLDTLQELKTLENGEQTRWTELCHALLNANEFIYIP